MASRTPPAANRSPRTQSIRSRIVVLLAIPLVSLVCLWVFLMSITIGESRELRDSEGLRGQLIEPSIMLLTSLQHERRMSVAYVGDRAMDRAGLQAQRNKTDQLRRVFQSAVGKNDVRGRIRPEVLQRIDQAAGRLAELDAIRKLVDQRDLPRSQVMSDYTALVDGLHDCFRVVTMHDGRLTKEMENLLRLGRARELISREDALVTGVLVAGRWGEGEAAEFQRLVGAKNLAMSEAVSSLTGSERTAAEDLLSSANLTRLQRMEERLLVAEEAGRRLPIEQGTWLTTSEAVLAQMTQLEARVGVLVSRRTDEVKERTSWHLLGAGGAGLLVIVLSAVVGWRIGNRLVRESRRVSRTVSAFTDRQLPALREMVREGKPVDPNIALPDQKLQVTEIARISDAFTKAGRAVLEAAAREIEARNAINEVFVTLARRNQALVHRQLTLLDVMERNVEDPDELEDLFRLDHLATRMRRHAEGLVILAGRTAGRTWRNPVPLVDVVRGAVAEVEDYTRVNVLSMPAAALAGNAVADTIHLLAELIENATLFSPPTAPVRVTGQLVPNGLVVEIEDRGLGLKPETLEELNRRLADPPEFDLSDLGRLGLFVVARLAERHHIKVSLRASPYGGTTAIVLVPAELIVESPSGGPPPAELRAQLPGSTPGRGTAQPEQTTPVARAVPDPPRPVQEVAPVSVQDRTTGPQSVAEPGEGPGEGDGEAPAELPRRRRTSGGPVAPVPTAEEAAEESPQHPAGTDGASNGTANGKAAAAPLELTPDGLPRRRRQENLAPGLRGTTAPQQIPEAAGAPPATATPEADPDGRFEVVRTRMAAMQRGWQRGRAEAEEDQGTQEDGQ